MRQSMVYQLLWQPHQSSMHNLGMTQQVKLDVCQCSRQPQDLAHCKSTSQRIRSYPDSICTYLPHHELESVVVIAVIVIVIVIVTVLVIILLLS